MVEMTIESIRVSMLNYQRVVILKEKSAERFLPIWIGPAEADAIAVKLQEVTVPRPLTHDLLSSVINALGASVNSIIVCDLRNDTFFAKMTLPYAPLPTTFMRSKSFIETLFYNELETITICTFELAVIDI